MPDSGLYTAELDGRVGYIYDSQVQLIGNQSAQWDQATGDDEFHLQRLPSIYSQPAHLTRVLFKVIAVIDHTLHEPDALPFRVRAADFSDKGGANVVYCCVGRGQDKHSGQSRLGNLVRSSARPCRSIEFQRREARNDG